VDADYPNAARLLSVILHTWQDTVCFLPFWVVDFQVLNPVLRAMDSSCLLVMWVLAVNGAVAGMDVLCQVQTMVLLCRKASFHSAQCDVARRLCRAAEGLCLGVFAKGDHLLLRWCLEWYAILLAGILDGDKYYKAAVCSDAMADMLRKLCENDDSVDVDTFETALWCLQFAPSMPCDARLLHAALDKYGSRPKCLGACAGCVAHLGKCGSSVQVRCLALLMQTRSEWAVDVRWLQPAMQLLLRGPVRRLDQMDFGLWLLRTVSVCSDGPDAVACIEGVCRVLRDMVCVRDDHDRLLCDPVDVVLTLCQFFMKSVTGDVHWHHVWRHDGPDYQMWMITHFEKAMERWLRIVAADKCRLWTEPHKTVLVNFVRWMIQDKCGTLSKLMPNLLTIVRTAGYSPMLFQDLTARREMSHDMVSTILAFKPFHDLATMEWSPRRHAWCVAVVRATAASHANVGECPIPRAALMPNPKCSSSTQRASSTSYTRL